MDERTRHGLAVGGVVVLFICIQLGALALLDPYVAADAQPVDDPSNEGNVALFLGVILVATALMLAAMRLDLEVVLKGVVLLASGWITVIVMQTLLRPVSDVSVRSEALTTAFSWVPLVVPYAIGLGLLAALYLHPEWYVIDATGLVLGAGAAGLFGLAFTPQLAIAFLVVLAVYDAVSVYGTEHMLTLAEGVSDLNLPVLLVVPTTRSFSLIDGDGPATLPDDGDATESPTDARAVESDEVPASPASPDSHPASVDDDPTDSPEEAEPESTRDAIFIGLGDAVMPTILAVSAAHFHRDAAALFDIPLIAVNWPALGAVVGTLVGLVGLLVMVLRGRAHAGLPMLNGGAILGYLLGALASGISIADALGLPL